MRLVEAIIEANHRAVSGDDKAGLHPKDFAESLPIVALTCIDARLNHLFPAVLGLPEDKFIWLRNSGNVIFDPMSSMTRTLALACAIKGGREIAIIGHSDCLVCKTSVMALTDRFRELGVERSRLPDNLIEFFGLFSSERQNVMRAVETVRSSPLIGPKVPVHGLMVALESGRLEWIVNGYQVLEGAVSLHATTSQQSAPQLGTAAPFNLGEMKFPEFKIGETRASIPLPGIAQNPASGQTAQSPFQPFTPAAPVAHDSMAPIGGAIKLPSQEGLEKKRTWAMPEHPAVPEDLRTIAENATERIVEYAAREVSEVVEHLALNPVQLFRILGSDQKTYGPVTGSKLMEWLADSRIDGKTPAQLVGQTEWKPLKQFVVQVVKGKAKPPPIPFSTHPRKR